MSTEPLLAERHPGSGPRWRVVIVRPGQASRTAAGEIATQLRAAGCMAIDIDTSRSDPFVDARSDSAHLIATDAYDLVITLDGLTPAVVALALLADAPVVTVSINPPDDITGTIAAALHDGRVRVLPAARVTIDGDLQFTTSPVAITADSNAVVRWRQQGRRGRVVTPVCELHPVGGPDALVEIRTPDADHIRSRQVDIHNDDIALRVDFNGRSRRARVVSVEGLPGGLRQVDLSG